MKCASTKFLTHEARIQFFNQQELVNSGVFPCVVRFGRPDLKKEAIRDPVFGPTFHNLQVPLSRVNSHGRILGLIGCLGWHIPGTLTRNKSLPGPSL